jgi:mannose-6-phosphate isomerase-like protein (cupin superfamily)
VSFEAFEHADLKELRAETAAPYLEFLQSSSFELGLYELAAGTDDHQEPHDQDEVYVVLEGRGRFRIGEDDLVVEPGSILFVEKHVEHRFHTIEEDLSIFVAFAPPLALG